MANNLGKKFEYLSDDCDFVKYVNAFQTLKLDIDFYVNSYNLQSGEKYKELVVTVKKFNNMKLHFYDSGRFDYCERT